MLGNMGDLNTSSNEWSFKKLLTLYWIQENFDSILATWFLWNRHERFSSIWRPKNLALCTLTTTSLSIKTLSSVSRRRCLWWNTIHCVFCLFKIKWFVFSQVLMLHSNLLERAMSVFGHRSWRKTVESSANKIKFESSSLRIKSFMKIINNICPAMQPCGTPNFTDSKEEQQLLYDTYCSRLEK